MAGLMLVAFASRALMPPGFMPAKWPAANVEPDGQGTAQDVVAFTSGDGKFRTGMHKAAPEHEEYKSGYESNEFISWPACEVD
jgi:hypothetical protein